MGGSRWLLIEKQKILDAKERLGDKNADIIAELLNLEGKKYRYICPFHGDVNPSFVYNHQTYSYHCFGCNRNIDIIDAYMQKNYTFIEATQKLFDIAGIKYNFSETNIKTRFGYKYPQEIKSEDRTHVYEYLKTRGISKETIDYVNLRQDIYGNIVFNFYDLNDVLTMVKYRPSRAVERKERKMWFQEDTDKTPLLFNMNRINVSQPLLITEGEIDCLSAIEAGYINAVSVPYGAGSFTWINENLEWLDQFEQFIICSDNDEAGQKMQKEIIYRLGTWKCRIVDIPLFFEKENGEKIPIKDLNDVLIYFGKQKVFDLIVNAKETPVEGVKDFSDIEDIDLDEIDGIQTGFKEVDKNLMKLFYGTFNILTGINGCVDADTEYFNGYEWKKISEYRKGERVLQYDLYGNASLVEPIRYHKLPCSHLWYFKSSNGIDQCLSDEHDIVYKTRNGEIQKEKAINMIRKIHSFNGDFITTFRYDGEGISLTDEQIRVMCVAVYSDALKTYNKCGIKIKDAKKQERLETLLTNADISFMAHIDDACVNYEFNAPLCSERFYKSWHRFSQHQFEIIVDEISNWFDKKIKLDKRVADFIQFAFSVCGKKAVINQKREKYSIDILDVRGKVGVRQVVSKDGYKYCFTVPSGMLVLRRNGRINITGNSGKTSLLSQIICQTLDQNKNVFFYSGELSNHQTKNWINYIFAGQRNLKEYYFDDNKYWKISPEAKHNISNYYRGKLYLHEDGFPRTANFIQKKMEDCVRKFGVKLIILDNLTAIDLENNDSNKYEKQTEFITHLIDFAKKYNVVIILVVHPHKMDTVRRVNKMDIQGTMALTDLAHRVLSLYRVSDKDKEGEKNKYGGWKVKPIKYDVLLDILKDRMRGKDGCTVGLFYDIPSRRFFTNEKDLDYKYNWDKNIYKTPLPFPPSQLKNNEEEIFGS